MHAHVEQGYAWLRDWSREGGSYPTYLLSGAGTSRERSSQDNKSQGCCCRNSRPTVINPDYNMTKQICIKRIYDKTR